MKKILISLTALSFLASCSTNPITGRSQLSLVSNDELNQQGAVEYQKFLSENPVIKTGAQAEMVKRVGTRIANAITTYYKQKGQSSVLDGYNWQFNLVDNKEANAWCMPGGKVAVYTGLLPITQDETSLAIVLGHEITHAVANHSNERMSQVLMAQGVGTAAGAMTSGKGTQIFNNVYGPAASLGVLLPNSRKQELEADHYGLIFAAMAGYDPRKAVAFWERMQAASNGQKPPEFLSTHPSDNTRINQLQKYIPEALKYYNKKK